MNAAILLLAGQSQRLNYGVKKQFFQINDKPLFLYAFEKFLNTKKFQKIVLVISKDDFEIVNTFLKPYNNDDIIGIVFGGQTRKESVNNALLSLKNILGPTDNVLIHDAARALISTELIENILSELSNSICVVPAINVVDSMVKANSSTIESYVNRDDYKLIQTPQGFKYEGILNAHINLKNKDFSDDASLMHALNIPIKIIEGDRFNIKVTTKQDLEIVKYILEGRKWI